MVQFLEQWALRRVPQGKWAKGEKGGGGGGGGTEQKNHPQASPVTQTLDSAPLCSCCLRQLARSAASLGPASSEGSMVLLATEAVHTPLMEFLSLHFPVRTEPASLTLLLSLRKLFFFPSPHTLFNPNNIWELQPLSYKRETDLEGNGGRGGIQFQTHWTITKF